MTPLKAHRRSLSLLKNLSCTKTCSVWKSVCRRRSITFRKLVDLTKLRWRIERDYQELKQEVGLGHFEGRGWRGFHHHATLCIAAYGFLVSERERFPQDLVTPIGSKNLPFPKVIDPGDSAAGAERHVPNSIATSL